MPTRSMGLGWILSVVMLASTTSAWADGAPLHLGLSVADPDKQSSVHEAVMIALTKAGFDPADDDGITPDAAEDDLEALSKKHSDEAVLLVKVEADGKRFKINALAVAGVTTHEEIGAAKSKGLEAEVARVASKAATAVGGTSANDLFGGPIGRNGVEVGLSGLGVLALGYIPALILAGKYGSAVPNASRAGSVPIVGAFNARGKLSDEILNDGASPGLIADGSIQLLGALALATGVGLVTYAKIQQYRANQAANPTPAVAVAVAPVLVPGFAGAGVTLSW